MDGWIKTSLLPALVSAVLVLAIIVVMIVISSRVHGADVGTTECSASRGGRDHWAWREIDGRRCWYLGRRGRAKETLSWGRPRPSRPVMAQVVAAPPPETPPAPAPMYQSWPTPPAVNPEELRDAWLANNCCWPPLAELVGDTSHITIQSITKAMLLTIFPVVVLTALYAASMVYPMKGTL